MGAVEHITDQISVVPKGHHRVIGWALFHIKLTDVLVLFYCRLHPELSVRKQHADADGSVSVTSRRAKSSSGDVELGASSEEIEAVASMHQVHKAPRPNLLDPVTGPRILDSRNRTRLVLP